MFAVLNNVSLNTLAVFCIVKQELPAFHTLWSSEENSEKTSSRHLMRVIYQYSVHLPPRSLRIRNHTKLPWNQPSFPAPGL
jgi:hypothetical protein